MYPLLAFYHVLGMLLLSIVIVGCSSVTEMRDYCAVVERDYGAVVDVLSDRLVRGFRVYDGSKSM